MFSRKHDGQIKDGMHADSDTVADHAIILLDLPPPMMNEKITEV